ncbi:hypothetical protein KP509_17G043100 [Ceratopteris richardii]|uniref:Uncharacterized protein n=1 Tax=Ceratopteris richardii TaxID=49495 RepID=A0A8T2SXS0_CERRI|nr:hypothetical protein KP509_17G043100 [Ceratopteris richardii]
MARVYVGSIDPRTTERELEDEFRVFGVLRSVWVARRPPGYAFVDFDDKRDAMDAIKSLNGRGGWRVEMARSPRGARNGRGDEKKCYECNEVGHFARECHLRIGSSRAGYGRRYRSRSRSRSRSYSPRYRNSPGYRRSLTPRRRHSSRSPSNQHHHKSPSVNGRSRDRWGYDSRSSSPIPRRPRASSIQSRSRSPPTLKNKNRSHSPSCSPAVASKSPLGPAVNHSLSHSDKHSRSCSQSADAV